MEVKSCARPLQDRVAIVTGSSRGIGKGIALHLASLGAKLVINYTSPTSEALANDVVSQVNSQSGTPNRAVAVRADVSDPAQVQTLFDKAQETFLSHPHILVTPAGVIDPGYPTIAETDVSTFERIMSINIKGTFLCIKEGARRIKQGGGGRIVTVSSSLTAALLPGYGSYTAGSAAVEAMTKILAKELKGTGITANCVGPGPIETELLFEGKTSDDIQRMIDINPMGRLGKVEDVAHVVGFLVSDGGEWVNGQVVRANGGYVS